MKFRKEINEYVTDIICNDIDEAINFIDYQYEINEHVKMKINELSDDELIKILNEKSIPIDDFITDLKRGDN